MASIELDVLPSGSRSDLTDYSVQEDATTIDVSTFDGAWGQVTFGVDDFLNSYKLMDNVATLSDGSRGKFQSVIRAMSGSDGRITLTGDSITSLFNAWVAAVPYNGTLGGYITYLCGLVTFPNPITVDASVTSRSVVAPGFVGNLWDRIKMFLAAQGVEMSLVFDTLVVRPLRTITAFSGRTTTESYDINNQTTAETVEITYYNHVWGAQKEAYPVPLADAPQPFIVNSGETITQLIQLEGSLLAINQPVMQNYVNNASYAGTNGVYAVSGNDGLPITTTQWAAQGGSLSVRITEDPSIVEVTIHGAVNTTLAPFRIAMTAGSSSYYNALHITGTGTLWNKKILTLSTGAPPSATGETVGITVDNPYINTLDQAYTRGLIVAATYAGPTYTISGSAFSLNRPDTDNSVISSTFQDFDVAMSGKTFAQFDTLWSGQTFAQFDTYWVGLAQTRFSNQLFGQGVGARLVRNDAVFRITSTTTTPSSVDYAARLDTTFDDFDNGMLSQTFAQFDLAHAGDTMSDFAIIPLRRG